MTIEFMIIKLGLVSCTFFFFSFFSFVFIVFHKNMGLR